MGTWKLAEASETERSARRWPIVPGHSGMRGLTSENHGKGKLSEWFVKFKLVFLADYWFSSCHTDFNSPAPKSEADVQRRLAGRGSLVEVGVG